MITVGIPFYGLPFFYDYFIKEFGWSRAQTTSGIAIATILIQPVGGLLVHRFSPRKLIMAGTALTCLAFTGFAHMNGSLWLYYGLFVVYNGNKYRLFLLFQQDICISCMVFFVCFQQSNAIDPASIEHVKHNNIPLTLL